KQARRHYSNRHAKDSGSNNSDNPTDDEDDNLTDGQGDGVANENEESNNEHQMASTRTEGGMKRLLVHPDSVNTKRFRETTKNVNDVVMRGPHSRQNEKGFGFILPAESVAFLRSSLPAEYDITRVSALPDDARSLGNEIQETHDPISEDHFKALETGGCIGLEKVVGAIIVTGSSQLQ
ncbi:hypothetical protein BGX26_008136, partial [Mortierella sp. AD094]